RAAATAESVDEPAVPARSCGPRIWRALLRVVKEHDRIDGAIDGADLAPDNKVDGTAIGRGGLGDIGGPLCRIERLEPGRSRTRRRGGRRPRGCLGRFVKK